VIALATLVLASAVAGAAPAGQAAPSTGVSAEAKAPPNEAPSPLAALDAALARDDTGAASTWLRDQAARLAADDRFALDAIYVLLGRRRFAEARDQWNALIPRLREALAGPAAGGDEAGRRRRVGEAQFVQGLLAARFGTREEALGLLRDADGNGFPPLDSPLMRLAADTLLELDEPALAAQAYAAVLERAPAADVRVRRAAALFAAGRLAAADEELGRVRRTAPSTPWLEYWTGVVRFEQRRMDEATAHMERELARDPRCAGCLATLAHVAYLAGDDRRCEALLDRAAAIDPENLDTNLVYGMVYNRTGRTDRAIERLARVVARAPGHAKAQYQLALAYQRAGDPAKAREHREAYERLVREQKARSVGVRGAEE
jgi:tetratricopeptide (TPR) repeat protein